MDKRQLEIMGACGHGIGATINLLGVIWNWKGNKFYRLFHIGGVMVHGYAVYMHIRDAKPEDANGPVHIG